MFRWLSAFLLFVALWCAPLRAEGLFAIDEEGRHVPPDGKAIDMYHGNGGYTETDIPRLFREGLPAKPGTDLDLKHHKLEHRDGQGLTTAFRGAAPYAGMPGANALTPVEAADAGGLVFMIRGVPMWDVARHAPGAERLVPGEAEYAILARVEPQHIVKIGVVAENRMGNKYVKTWFENPALAGR